MKDKYVKLDDVKRLLDEGYYVPDKPFDAIRKLPCIEIESEDPTPKLLPCPNCGSYNILCNSKPASWGYYNSIAEIKCNSCGISILYRSLDNNESAEDAKREAIRHWNDLRRRK